MSRNIFYLLALFTLTVANDVIITREYVWQNYKDFIDYGWVEYYTNSTKTYSTPSELDLRLYELNGNFTDEVWGGTQVEAGRPRIRYQVDIQSKPEYCGMINATATFKYYLEGNTAYEGHKSFIWPGCSTTGAAKGYCYIDNSNFSTWTTKTMDVALSVFGAQKILIFDARLSSTGLVLLDEVRLTYTVQQGLHNCPHSCVHDCKYRGIDCHNFYTCIDRRNKEYRTCDKNKGLAFNPVTKSCDLIENVEGCHDSKPTPPPHCVCEYRPHETNCSKYYYCPDICLMEKCEEMSCPGGLLWSMDAKGDGSGQQQCAPANEASCSDDNISTTVSTQTFETTEIQDSTAQLVR